MVHLTSGDLRNLQDCTRRIYSGIDTGSFPGHIIAATSRLIPSSVVSCAEITTQKKSVIYAPTVFLPCLGGIGRFRPV